MQHDETTLTAERPLHSSFSFCEQTTQLEQQNENNDPPDYGSIANPPKATSSKDTTIHSSPCWKWVALLWHSYLTRPRILYATTFVWLSILGGRFTSTFLEHEANLDDAEIGICLAWQQAAIALCSSGAGALADRMQRHHRHGRLGTVVGGVVLGTAVGTAHALPQVVPWLVVSPLFFHATLQGLFGFAVSAIFSVLDALTIDFLEASPGTSRQEYGKERLHGPLWWAVSNFAMSPLFDAVGFEVCYPLSIGAAVAVVLAAMIFAHGSASLTQAIERDAFEEASLLRATSATDDTVNGSNKATTSGRQGNIVLEIPTEMAQGDERNGKPYSVRQLFFCMAGSTFGIAFLACLFCITAGQSLVDNLVFLFFENDLKIKYIFMGIMVVIKIAFEAPALYYGRWLIDTLGASGVMLLGCACYFTRVLFYSFMQGNGGPSGPYAMVWALMLEPLHGITYACSQLSQVEFVAQMMPSLDYEATGQGLIYLFKDGGSVLGVGLGGWIDEYLGSQRMFQMSALIVLGGALILTTERDLIAWIARTMRSSSEEDNDKVSLCRVHAEESNEDEDSATYPSSLSSNLDDSTSVSLETDNSRCGNPGCTVHRRDDRKTWNREDHAESFSV